MIIVRQKGMIRIRQATLEDAETVSRIVCLCYEGFGQTDAYPGEVINELKKRRGSVERIRELITSEHVFIAGDENDVMGMVSVKENEITKLYVHPNHQGKGIGKRLFTHAEIFIQGQDYQRMFLGAAGQSALAFYEKMGMRVTQRHTIDCGPCIGMTSIVLEKKFAT